MNLVIYANTGPKVGLGHIYRCLPIASIFRDHQWDVDLYTPEDISSFEKGWKKSLFIDIFPKIKFNSTVILDSYEDNNDWQQLISQRPDLTFVRFDDRKDSIEGEDLIINTAPNAQSKNYSSDALCGPEFSLMDSIFLDYRKNNIDEGINSIIVGLGGSDVNNKISICKFLSRLIYIRNCTSH